MCGYLWEDPEEVEVPDNTSSGSPGKSGRRRKSSRSTGVPEWFPWLAIFVVIASLAVLALVYQNLQ